MKWIELHTSNINREDGVFWSSSWKPHSLPESRRDIQNCDVICLIMPIFCVTLFIV